MTMRISTRSVFRLLDRLHFLIAVFLLLLLVHSLVSAHGTESQAVAWDSLQNLVIHDGGHGIEFESHNYRFVMDMELDEDLFKSTGDDQMSNLQPLVAVHVRIYNVDDDTLLFDLKDPALARFLLDYEPAIDGQQDEDWTLLGSIQFGDILITLHEPLLMADDLTVSKRPSSWTPETEDGQSFMCGSDTLVFNQIKTVMNREQTVAASLSNQSAQMGAARRAVSKHVRMDAGNERTAPRINHGRYKRRNEKQDKMTAMSGNEFGSQGTCPMIPKLLPVAIVADCNYVGRMGGIEAARRQLLSELNTVSAIYLNSFNIGLAVTSLLMYEECDAKSYWEEPDAFNIPCSDYPGLEEVLNRFSVWRDEGLGDSKMPTAAVVHLVTSCHFSERVGLAWINQVCRTKSFKDSMADTISGTSVSVAVFPKSKNNKPSQGGPIHHASIIAHEIAHNLGAVHDCSDAACANGMRGIVDDEDVDVKSRQGAADAIQCCRCAEAADGCDCGDQHLMAGRIGALIVQDFRSGNDHRGFSQCTITDVCGKLAYLGSCLMDESGRMDRESLFGAASSGLVLGNNELRQAMAENLIAICGNGIREGSEECDCGTPEECELNPCCNSDCTLKPGARCSDQNDICCAECRIVSAKDKVLCRPTNALTANCQSDTYCDGKSEACPASEIKPNLHDCGNTQLLSAVQSAASSSSANGQCASGICTSRDEQCAVFGRHLQLTKACPYTKRSCSVICENGDQCIDLRANFIDGTLCGDSGTCNAGMCSEFGSGAQAAHQTGAIFTKWRSLWSNSVAVPLLLQAALGLAGYILVAGF